MFYIYQDLPLQWDHLTLPTPLATTLHTRHTPHLPTIHTLLHQDLPILLHLECSPILASTKLVSYQLPWYPLHLHGQCLADLQDLTLTQWLQVHIQESLLQLFAGVRTPIFQNGVTIDVTTKVIIMEV